MVLPISMIAVMAASNSMTAVMAASNSMTLSSVNQQIELSKASLNPINQLVEN